MKLIEIQNILEEWSPLENSEDFDNVGLIIGNPNSEVNGALITKNIPYYFLPTKLDNEMGFLGDKYYVQDESSKNEFKKYLRSLKIDIEVKKVEFSMVRTKNSLKDKKSSKK